LRSAGWRSTPTCTPSIRITAAWWTLKNEDKGSDVNPATRLLIDAVDKSFDAAVIITNDSDLAEPIRQVRRNFGYRVMILHSCSKPGSGPSNALRKAIGMWAESR
jgi:NYN domain